MYDHTEEVRNRLSGTICLYKGDPVYIRDISADGKDWDLRVTRLPVAVLSEDINVKFSNPEFSYRNIPLGYANIKGTATYFVRKPLRRFKQGISDENLATLDGFKYNRVPFRARDGGDEIRWNTLVASPDFAKMFHADYPSFQQAAKMVLRDDENKTTVAFNREFALKGGFDKILDLWHKGRKIAWSEDAQKFKLAEEFLYFKETLARTGIQAEERVRHVL